ncbi:MAG: hypothetical protein U0325_25435, partial [Polyangiales bacterium]
GATVVTVSTAPRASGAPNLTVHRYDVRRQRALPTQVVLSVAEAERAMAGAAPLAAMRAVVEARVAATQALFRTLGLRTLTRGGEATADAARTEAWRDIDSSRVRSAMGWLTVTLRAAPVPARFRMRLPAAGTGLRCRDANPGYLGAAWIERSLLVARIDYAGTNLCQAPAPRWVVRAVRVP